MKNYSVVIFLLYCALPLEYACAVNQQHILVDGNILKAGGINYGEGGRVDIDINDDGEMDTIEYMYSDSTPPGTCDKLDCLSSINEQPILTFYIKIANGDTINIPFMCTSIGVENKKHKGMRDVFCGPKYHLIWDGREYFIK